MRGPLTGPGDDELTLTPNGPTSVASVLVKPMTAIVDAAYAVRWISGRLPLTEATSMTTPPH